MDIEAGAQLFHVCPTHVKPGRVTRAGAGVKTGVGVPLGVAEGVALGTTVAVRVGTGVPVGLGVVDGAAVATESLGDGAGPRAPKAVPSQPARIAPRPNKTARAVRYEVRVESLRNNGDPP